MLFLADATYTLEWLYVMKYVVVCLFVLWIWNGVHTICIVCSTGTWEDRFHPTTGKELWISPIGSAQASQRTLRASKSSSKAVLLHGAEVATCVSSSCCHCGILTSTFWLQNQPLSSHLVVFLPLHSCSHSVWGALTHPSLLFLLQKHELKWQRANWGTTRALVFVTHIHVCPCIETA